MLIYLTQIEAFIEKYLLDTKLDTLFISTKLFEINKKCGCEK